MALPSTFRAYQYDNYGPIETELKLRSGLSHVPLAAEQVRIKVHSAAVNPIDYKLAEFMGQMKLGKAPSAEQPFGIGFDVAGEIVEVGSGITKMNVGDAVYTALPPTVGSLAEYVVAGEARVARKPSNLDFNEAAAVPTVALTAYAGMLKHAKLQKGHTILILGGSSAVGMFAIQIAHALGARVVATTSTRNVELVKSLGADQVVDYTKEKWLDVLTAHSVDAVYDCGFEPMAWNDGAQVVLKKNTGRFITLLPMQGAVKESEFGAELVGFVSGSDLSAGPLREISKYIEAGQVKVVIDSIYPFDEVLDAYTKLKTGHAQGKLVVQVHP